MTDVITFWIFLFLARTTLGSQEANYLDSEPPELFQLADSVPLLLNDSYCLHHISVQLVTPRDFRQPDQSSHHVRIIWQSKALMTSIKLESDSLNDSYCDAENKHYYYRKPSNQTFHVFPDEVNEGVRFLPIKLDCQYLITPELEGMCRPLRLRYSTPVCVDNETCSCRNVNMTGPKLEGVLERGGIGVVWSFPGAFPPDVASAVITIYSEDGINTRELLRRKVSVREAGLQLSQHFPVNTSSENLYRIQGYFENRFSCRGNSTFLLLRRGPAGPTGPSYETILSYALALMFLFLFVLVCLLYYRKKQVKRICKKLPHMVWNPPYLEQSRDSYLFDYRDLVIVREIASGNFGVVYLAYSAVSLRGCNEFAIKQIKDTTGPEGVSDFIEEINMFKMVGDHQNVVKMFGYCLAPQPLTIIMEYVPFNLLLYLKSLREEFGRKNRKHCGSPVTYAQLTHSRRSSMAASECNYISRNDGECLPLRGEWASKELEHVLDNRELEIFAFQIARGMAHLESRNIVHRDLAARNVLMDEAKVLKISDFGMSRSGIYVNRSSRKFPLRWMSPEAVVSRVYSNKSDVWSFGVVLWEIGTLGAFPYSSLQNEEVISLLTKGGHLDRPDNVTAQLYDLMLRCWAPSPDDRPSFKDLSDSLGALCHKSNGYLEFDDLEPSYVFPPMEEDVTTSPRPPTTHPHPSPTTALLTTHPHSDD